MLPLLMLPLLMLYCATHVCSRRMHVLQQLWLCHHIYGASARVRWL
jgi:hypothetical protein